MIKPFGKRLLVLRRETSIESSGGIIIPDECQGKPTNEGVVIDASDDCTLKPGNYVIFGDFDGKEIEWEGVLYLLLMEDDVIAFMEKAE
tara:strand:+ start:13110 stop:13376 length:267 start_codon:yes stop_codon:yes gene_type:complete